MTKVMTIVGTRPEIIRLSEVMKRLDRSFDHVLVHTGQNWDPLLNEVFFDDLGLRTPDRLLRVRTDSLGQVLADVDLAAVQAAGHSTATVVVTNTAVLKSVTPASGDAIAAGETAITVTP